MVVMLGNTRSMTGGRRVFDVKPVLKERMTLVGFHPLHMLLYASSAP